jgi:hypothetical protein
MTTFLLPGADKRSLPNRGIGDVFPIAAAVAAFFH